MTELLKTVMGGTDLSGVAQIMGGADLSGMAQQVEAALGASGTADRPEDLPIWTHPAFVDMFGRPFNLDARVGDGSPDTLANAVNSGLSLLESLGLSSGAAQQGAAVLQASGATGLVSKAAHNGRSGDVLRWLPDKGRYEVMLKPDGDLASTLISLKPANLVIAS